MQNRKDFIKLFLRIFMLAIIAAISGILMFRETNDAECNFDFVCKNCKKNKNCNLPEANNFRNNQ